MERLARRIDPLPEVVEHRSRDVAQIEPKIGHPLESASFRGRLALLNRGIVGCSGASGTTSAEPIRDSGSVVRVVVELVIIVHVKLSVIRIVVIILVVEKGASGSDGVVDDSFAIGVKVNLPTASSDYRSSQADASTRWRRGGGGRAVTISSPGRCESHLGVNQGSSASSMSVERPVDLWRSDTARSDVRHARRGRKKE
jgi:hypothetical protein